MGTAQGFWSYVHKDNEGMHGAIVRVARHVQDEYGVITGGLELDLFLDNMKLKWGDKWRARIHEEIENSTFFIPIITPRYFKSEECRNELSSFAEQAKELGREALIMPLYFVEVPDLEAGDSDDPLIRLVADSQMEDWRTLRFLDETTQPYRLALGKLAERLREVSRERESATPSKSQPAEDDDESDQVTQSDLATPHADGVSGPEERALDQLVEGEEAFPRLVVTLNNIAPEIKKIGEMAVEATKEMADSDARGGGFKGRLVVVNRLASKFEVQADQLERLTSEYVADLLVVDPAVRRMIQLAAETVEQHPEETTEFLSSIETMIDGSEDAAGGLKELIKSFDQAGSLTRVLDPPLNRLRSSLQSMIDSNKRMDHWRRDIEAARAKL